MPNLYRRRFEFLKRLAGRPYTQYEAKELLRATRISVDMAYRLLDRILAAYDAALHPEEFREQLERAEAEEQKLYSHVRPLIERQKERKRAIDRLFVRLAHGEDVASALTQMISGNERGYQQSDMIDKWKAKKEECRRLERKKLDSHDPSFLSSAPERYRQWKAGTQDYKKAKERGWLEAAAKESERIRSGCLQLEKELYGLEQREEEVFTAVELENLGKLKSGAKGASRTF